MFHLDLSKVSYPKPIPPDLSVCAYSPHTSEEWMAQYRRALALWNDHQTKLKAAEQELSIQQQKVNDNYSKLLEQYKEIQKLLLKEIEAHSKETQEISELKSTMETLTKMLHDIMKK